MTIICPHCHANDGFYVKEQVRGTAAIYYNNKGDYEFVQTSMYDNLSHSGGKLAYCQNCDKTIGKSKELKSRNIEKELW